MLAARHVLGAGVAGSGGLVRARVCNQVFRVGASTDTCAAACQRFFFLLTRQNNGGGALGKTGRDTLGGCLVIEHAKRNSSPAGSLGRQEHGCS